MTSQPNHPHHLRRRAWPALAALLMAAGIAAAGPISEQAKQEVLLRLQEVLSRKAYVGGVKFERLPEFLASQRRQLEHATTEEAFAMGIQRSLEQFGVSHVAIIPPSAAEAMQETAEIGVGINCRPATGGLRVVSIPDDSPAKDSSLRPGDIIIDVDGRRPESPDDLQGPAGSTATLRVRKLSGQIDTVQIPRRLVEHRQHSTYHELSPKTALIRINDFAGSYDPTEIEDLVDRAFEHDNLILDLRGNGGGAVTNMQHLLGLLIPEGTPVGTPVSNAMAAQYVADTGGDPSDAAAVAAWEPNAKFRAAENRIGPFPGRIAVLIDGGSASASEVTAAAVREVRGGLLVGSKSAGALLVSIFDELAEGFKIQLPISDYITIKGFRPEGQGIEPDIHVQARSINDAPNAAREALEKP